MPAIDRFFQCPFHVLESPYCLQIRRCGKNCEFGCGAFRTPAYLLPDSYKTLQQIITEFMPLQMRDESETTLEKYFQYTAAQDASYRSVESIPSLQNKTDKSAITKAKKNRNSVRLTVSCGECGKKRFIFSKLLPSNEVKGQLGSFLEDMEDYICGDALFVEAEDGSHPLSLIFFNCINLTCADHIEPEYYHTSNLVKGGDECSYCLSETEILNEAELKQKKLLNGYKNSSNMQGLL